MKSKFCFATGRNNCRCGTARIALFIKQEKKPFDIMKLRNCMFNRMKRSAKELGLTLEQFFRKIVDDDLKRKERDLGLSPKRA